MLMLLSAVSAVTSAAAAGDGSCPGQDSMLLQRRSSLQLRRSASDFQSQGNGTCHTLLEDEPCYADVHWAFLHGIYDYPQFYPNMSAASSFEEFQAYWHALNPQLCPEPCTENWYHFPEEVCVSRATKLDFFNSDLSHRNLGGLGPDGGVEEMRYKSVGIQDKRPFDLVVRTTSTLQSYTPERTGKSGLYGIVNVKSGTAVDLNFRFEDSASESPVEIEAFLFSFLDLDQQSGDSHEMVYVDNFEKYTLDSATEVAVETADDGRTIFKSTRTGSKCDNPEDPMLLGEVRCSGGIINQRKRVVSLLYPRSSAFDVRLESRCASACHWGRSFMFAGSTALATSCEDMPKIGLCAAFGDPHFVTFDGAHTVFTAQMPIWLVRSERVLIQSLSKNSAGSIHAVAIGGDFLQGSRLVIMKDTPWSLQAFYDGQRVLAETEDEFHVEGLFDAYRRSTWNASLHNEGLLKVRTQMRFNVGPWPERFMATPVGGLYLFRLPENVEVTITGVDSMSVVITMPPQSGGQSGYCGDFNGDVNNDFEQRHSSFHKSVGENLGPVGSEDLLFDAALLDGQGSITPALDPDRIMDQCNDWLKDMAEQRCRSLFNTQMRLDCIFDVCSTGLISAAEGAMSAEMLEEKVDSRGIPVFMGQGRCLDLQGHPYIAFGTTLVSREDCTNVLRSLADTDGVQGAQLQENSTCQILVESGSDPAQVPIKGGWMPLVSDSMTATGHGIISNVTEQEEWSCWQLV